MQPIQPLQQVSHLRIAVIRLSSFGDIILSLKSLRNLFFNDYAPALNKNLELIFITKNKFVVLVEELWKTLEPALDRGISFSVRSIPDHASVKDLWNLARELHREEVHLTLDLHTNLRSRIIAFFLWPCICLRVSKPRLQEFLLFSGRKWGRHLISLKRWQRPLSLFRPSYEQATIIKASPSVPIRKEIRVGIAMESLWTTKQWDSKKFFALIQRIRNEFSAFKIYFTIIGERSSEPAFDFSAYFTSNDRDLRGKTKIVDLIPLVKNELDFLICNDSGLLHLAEILDVPVISVFGPTVPELGFGPTHPQSEIVQSDLWCRPCSKTGRLCHRTKNPQLCLKQVSVDDVFRSVRKMVYENLGL